MTELLLMCVSGIFHLLLRPLFVFFLSHYLSCWFFLKCATRISIIEHVLNPYELKIKKNNTIEQRHVVNCNKTGDHFVQWLISRLILVQLSTIQSQYFLSVDIFFSLPSFYCCCCCCCCHSTIICCTVSIRSSFDVEREHHWMKSIHFLQSRTVTHFCLLKALQKSIMVEHVCHLSDIERALWLKYNTHTHKNHVWIHILELRGTKLETVTKCRK